jgi:hypothetical protein
VFSDMMISVALAGLKGKSLGWIAFAFLTCSDVPPDRADVAWWLYNPANRAVLSQVAKDNGLIWDDELAGWDYNPPNLDWAQGCVYVVRCRAAGNPLPYPHDPKGPKKEN